MTTVKVTFLIVLIVQLETPMHNILISATMRKSGRLDADVDIAELATLTKNFSGAEIEGLVRAAQSTSLNSYVTATSKVRVLVHCTTLGQRV